MKDDILFVQSALNVNIKILKRGWDYIFQKHPELHDKFQLIIDCLQDADEVWISKQDADTHLYYKSVKLKYICVICKHYNGKGFLITAYFTRKLQGESKIWPK